MAKRKHVVQRAGTVSGVVVIAARCTPSRDRFHRVYVDAVHRAKVWRRE
jgi:hypothetical protein